jgi:DNA-binding XRE family transcriptional regulator
LTCGSDNPNINGMKIADLRKELQLTQEQFAQEIGLASKSYVCELEAGAGCSVRVALEIEKLSAGRIAAETLNPDVGLVRQSGDAQP